MNVVFLTRSYYPNIGGVEKHIYKLSEQLDKNKIKLTIFSEKSYSNDYHSLRQSANDAGETWARVIEINPGKEDWFKKFRIWKELFRNIDVIRNADIIHCHDVYFWYLPFRFIFPRKKNFVTFHGYEGDKIPGRKAIFMHKLAELLSNGNICIGKFLTKWYKTKPSFISYGAVDKRLMSSYGKSRGNLWRGVFVGRLELETGILEYLNAIKLLKDKNVNLILDVLGEGSLKDEAKFYVESNNLSVNFLGYKMEIENLLPKYKFALVSRYLSILESLAARVPVFAHYNNEIKKDYLEMTPFAKFIDISNDHKVIASQLSQHISKGNSNTEEAYMWVKNKTWEEMASLYFNLWGLSSKTV